MRSLLSSTPRFFYPLTASIAREIYHAHWDAEIETTDDVVLVIYIQDVSTGQTVEYAYADGVSLCCWYVRECCNISLHHDSLQRIVVHGCGMCTLCCPA